MTKRNYQRVIVVPARRLAIYLQGFDAGVKKERSRAVRTCRNMRVEISRNNKEKLIYFEACSDCARAIGGGT